MKNKHKMIAVWAASALFMIARVLQNATVLGSDGFFIKDTAGQRVIAASLYVLMALAALGSFWLRREKKTVAPAEMLCVPMVRYLCYAVAAMIAVQSVGKLCVSDWTGLIGLPTAADFCLLARSTAGQSATGKNGMAFFALAYPCVRLIKLFFDTFRTIKASENILEITGLCAMVFFFIGLTKQMMNFEEPFGKTVWCAAVFSIFGTLIGPVRLLSVLMGRASLDALSTITMATDIVLWLFAMVCLIVLLERQPKPMTPPQSDGEE